MSGVAIVLDEVTPLLERVRTAAAAQGLALVAARAVGGLVKEHLYGLDQSRHRFGRHFYRQAGDSVTTGIVPQGAVVSITQTGFRQRLFGGTIRPKKEFLTIPAIPEAEGTRAGEWQGLHVALAYDPKLDRLRWALVRATPVAQLSLTKSGKIRRQHLNAVATGEPVFWLVREVTQPADPTVLPYTEQMTARATAAITTRLSRLAVRAAQADGYQN